MSGFPNGWKDGWSSADHATESYSPHAWEKSQRDAMAESSERDRRMSEYEAGLRRQQERREREQRERERQRRIEDAQFEYHQGIRNSKTATLVEFEFRKRCEAYEEQSNFTKLRLKLKKKDIYSQESQIRAEIKEDLDKMSSWKFDEYYDQKMEEYKTGGKSR